MAELFLLDRAGRTRRFPVGAEPLTVGRDLSNRIRLDDHCVSAFHAEISPSSEGHVLRDLGSLNATRVADAVISEIALSAFEVLCFGDLVAVYLDPARLGTPVHAAGNGVDSERSVLSEDPPRSLLAPRAHTSWWGPLPHIALVSGPAGEMLLFPTVKETVLLGRKEENDIVILDPRVPDLDVVLRRLPEGDGWVADVTATGDRTLKVREPRINRQRHAGIDVIDVNGFRCWLKSGRGIDSPRPAPPKTGLAQAVRSPATGGTDRNPAPAAERRTLPADPIPSFSFAILAAAERSSESRRRNPSAIALAPSAERDPYGRHQRLSGGQPLPATREGAPNRSGGEAPFELPHREAAIPLHGDPLEASGPAEPEGARRLLEEKAATIARLRGELIETTDALWRMKREKSDGARAAAMKLMQQENRLIEKLRREKASLYALLDR